MLIIQGGGRTNHHIRKVVDSNMKALKTLLEIVFNDYGLILKQNRFYQDYREKLNNKFSEQAEIILKGSLEDDSLESIMYPTGFNHEKIQNLSDTIKEHIDKLNLDKENYEFARDRTTSLFNKTKNSIEDIQKFIVKIEKEYNSTESMFKTVKDEDVFTDYEGSREINLKEYYSELIIDLSVNQNNLNRHKGILMNLYEDLKVTYPYLSQMDVISPSRLTVFGDSNFEVVKQLSKENRFL